MIDGFIKPFLNSSPSILPYRAAILSPLTTLSLSLFRDTSFRTVTLKTWGGRDVNITTKVVRNLLEAVVLKGVVKNIKVVCWIDGDDIYFVLWISRMNVCAAWQTP